MNIDFLANQQLNSTCLWKSRDISYGSKKMDRINKRVNISHQPLSEHLFTIRGVEKGQIDTFVNPDETQLHDPYLFLEMKQAVDRIMSAHLKNEKVLIFGDYDVDGLTSASILYIYMKKRGFNVECYIPDRRKDGYGLSIGVLERINIKEYQLLITVDCGVTAQYETKWLKEQGVDVIVTDHHTYTGPLPDVYALIATTRPEETYPFRQLAGVGIAFKLMQAICIAYKDGKSYLDYLDLAALGTVADMVPLLGENRTIVMLGLKAFEDSKNFGLSAFVNDIRTGNGSTVIDADSLAFYISPRINAAGRVGCVRDALDLLLADSYFKAEVLVRRLNDYNNQRKEIEKEVLISAQKQLDENYDLAKTSFITLADDDWHEGVIGIVASRITEKYNRPCVLITFKNGVGRGSGRSIDGFDIFKCIDSASSLLDGFGGHTSAAGLSVRRENLKLLAETLNNAAAVQMKGMDIRKCRNADAIALTADLSIDETLHIEMMSPFGEKNRRPIIYSSLFKILECRQIGAENRHLKMVLEKDGVRFDAISFGAGKEIYKISGCKLINLLFSFSINSWRGADSFQIRIDEFKTLQWTRMMWAFYREMDNVFPYIISTEKDESAVDEIDYIKDSRIAVCTEKKPAQTCLRDFLNSLLEEDLSKGKRINIFVNELLSMDYVLKTALYDIAYRCPVRLVYGEDILDDATLDIAPAEDLPDCSTVYIYANTMPTIENMHFVTNDDCVNIMYGKWYGKNYFNKIKNAIIQCFGEVKMIGVGFLQPTDLLPNEECTNTILGYLKPILTRGKMTVSLTCLANKLSRTFEYSINPYKLFKGLELLEDSGELIINHLSQDVVEIIDKKLSGEE